MSSWVGVDLDGTLADHSATDNWKGRPPWDIGKPVPKMVERVKRLLDEGHVVKIFTARIAELSGVNLVEEVVNIQQWCLEHIGVALEVTCQKDFGMMCCYDDRAFQVIRDTGEVVGEA